jgi:Holliday junction resolvase RusA-like endonuclease
MIVNITLNIEPKALPRARHAVRGKFSSTYYPKQVKDTFIRYENEIIRAFSDLNIEQRKYIIDEIKEPKTAISLVLTFYMPIPKSWSKKKQREAVGKPHLKLPDTDNMIKLVLDRANGTLFNDDKYVYKICAEKIYSDMPRIELGIKYKEKIK